VPDFTRASWQRGLSGAQLLVSILEGKGDGMPAFGGRLNADQARGLVAHVRAFSGRPPAPAANPAPLAQPGEDFKEQFQALQREYEDLKRQMRELDSSSRPREGPPPGAVRSRPGDEEATRTLFREACAKCHGRDGRGAPARAKHPDIPDFSRRSWQEQRRDAGLVRSIMEGEPPAMPAQRGKLSEKQARDLVAYIRTFGPEPTKGKDSSGDDFARRPREPQEPIKKQNQELQEPAEPPHRDAPRAPSPGTTTAPAAVEAPAPQKGGLASAGLYRQRCARCHGEDGTGARARRRQPAIPDFTDAPWQGQRSATQLLAAILDGKGSDMPPWRGKISEDQARGLVASVRAFAPATESPGQERSEETSRAEATERAEPPMDFSEKLIAWLGNVHPAAVHFPLALLTAAPVAELLRLVTGKSAFDPVCRFCLWFGFLTAVPAATLGWFAGGLHLADASWVLRAHRWLGSSAVACAGLALALGEVSRRSGRFRLWFRITLFGAAGVVLATGFFGGALVFGLGHYAWPP
jgi:mono/diheme cytochrome c family protein/uncharacterized membrane protein